MKSVTKGNRQNCPTYHAPNSGRKKKSSFTLNIVYISYTVIPWPRHSSRSGSPAPHSRALGSVPGDHARLAVNKVAMEKVFFRAVGFPCQSPLSSVLIYHLSLKRATALTSQHIITTSVLKVTAKVNFASVVSEQFVLNSISTVITYSYITYGFVDDSHFVSHTYI